SSSRARRCAGSRTPRSIRARTATGAGPGRTNWRRCCRSRLPEKSFQLFRLDIGVADGAAEHVEALAQKRRKLDATRHHGADLLQAKLRFDLGRLDRLAEGGRKLRDRLCRRLCGREGTVPELQLIILEAAFCDGRNLRKVLDPLVRAGCKRAQLAGPQLPD